MEAAAFKWFGMPCCASYEHRVRAAVEKLLRVLTLFIQSVYGSLRGPLEDDMSRERSEEVRERHAR